jgi:hypothetical protein
MLGDAYVPGVIAAAGSLKCVNTKADISAMVNGVSKRGIAEMKRVVDYVVNVLNTHLNEKK